MSDAATPVPHDGTAHDGRADACPPASPARRGREYWGMRLLGGLPDPALAVLARRAQRPTKPARSVVPRRLVTRERIAGAGDTSPEVPVTWIDRRRARTATIVHLHGGAYLAAESPMHWRWLEELRRRAGTAAAMIQYRMPPSSPAPAAVDDALAAIRALQRRADLRDGAWVLSGDSAGGGIALAVVQAMRDADEPLPAGLLLTSPWTDLTLSDPTIPARATRDVVLDVRSLRRAADEYAGVLGPRDPRVSPRFGSVDGLPPVLLVAGEHEALQPDAQHLADDLRAAGTPVVSIEIPGGRHDHPVLADDPAAQWVIRRQIAFVREACGLRA